LIRGVLAAALVATGASCGDDAGTPPVDPEPAMPSAPRLSTAEDPIEPLRAPVGLVPARVALGRRLFADPILHERGTAACTHCHVAESGADPRPRSQIEGQEATSMNSPTMFNVSLNYKFTWTGRFVDMETQLEAPITSPRLMATTFPKIVARLSAHAEYPSLFAAAYPDGLSEANLRDSLVEYQRSLVTLDAPFDRWLRGEEAAIDDDARAGYGIFKDHGCISCHQGANVGGNMVQKFGVLADYFALRGGPISEADLGLYTVTKREEDRHVFRVPSLRNVALTAPYFHDGSAATLEQAVRTMSEVQLGRRLSPEQVRLVVAFLGSLTGEKPREPAP
jgi:cytochrome c peroxidase